MMHINKIELFPEQYPNHDHYPFDLKVFNLCRKIDLNSPITFFVGDNGTGKSTLLEAIAKKCDIHIWRNDDPARLEINPYEQVLHRFISVKWFDGPVPGAFFSSQISRNFAQYLEEWAIADPGILDYYGGESLLTQSHGQSLMAYFKARYKIKGLYVLDEPETALSPKSQLELLTILNKMSKAGHAQFIIASHSPIILACPGAIIYNFDENPIKPIEYENTEHYRVYKDFMENREKFLEGIDAV
jgi:predicted ATPase